MEILRNLVTPGIIGAIVAIVAVLIVIATGYVKAPPDVAYIISGLKKNPKILIGRAGIKIPFFERKDALLIRQISIDIKTGSFVPTKDYIGVKIDAIAKIRIMTDDEGIKRAMRNFLNMNEDQIIQTLTDSLQGNMREIVGTVTLDELCRDRKKFGDGIQEKAQDDMTRLGVEILSCNIQEIVDEQKLISQLGQDNMSQIQKNASIAKAEADRDVKIAQAKAQREANDAQVEADTAIAERQNALAIKQSELKKAADIKQAEADAAYKIQEQEQRKTIEIAGTNADIAKQEREVELKQREAEVKEQELAASVKKQADAERYRVQQQADAELYKRQKDAEARKYEEAQAAEAAKIKAEAEKYAAQQQAEGIRQIGEAEAASIKAKGLAEAEGIDKKAEAMKKMGEASVLEMFFNAYPQIMAAAAKPLENVDSITMFGEGNSAKVVGDIVTSTRQIMDGIEQSTGINLQSVLAGFLGGKLASGSDESVTGDSKDKPEDDSVSN